MRTINLNGYIDEEVFYGDEITPAMLHDALYGENGEFSDDVHIILNSYGGSCKRNFPSSFADAFDMLMKKNGDTRETIAEKLNVNSKSLQRWLKEPDRRINADFIVMLALIWRLPEWISSLLLDRAYIGLSESNRRHLALQYILKVLWSEGVEKASRVLIIAPLRVARDTWIGELSKWEHLKGLRMERILGTPNRRLSA